MESSSVLEEKLREAACYGDLDAMKKILAKGVNINARHNINGWTALHWASKRQNETAVQLLLAHSADGEILSNDGKTAAMLTDSKTIHDLLGGNISTIMRQELPITPNYMAYPEIGHKVEVDDRSTSRPHHTFQSQSVYTASERISGPAAPNEVVLKVRVADTADPDFIEVELSVEDLTYRRLLATCCTELSVEPRHVIRIRKLPDTIVRKDKDVRRLRDFQELEVVVSNQAGGTAIVVANGSINHSNQYRSIRNFKDQTIIY